MNTKILCWTARPLSLGVGSAMAQNSSAPASSYGASGGGGPSGAELVWSFVGQETYGAVWFVDHAATATRVPDA